MSLAHLLLRAAREHPARAAIYNGTHLHASHGDWACRSAGLAQRMRDAGLAPGDRVSRQDYDVVAVEADHRAPTLAYVLVEHTRLGRFQPERVRELGVPGGGGVRIEDTLVVTTDGAVALTEFPKQLIL